MTATIARPTQPSWTAPRGLFRKLTTEELRRLTPEQLSVHTTWLLERAGQSKDRPMLFSSRLRTIEANEVQFSDDET